MNLIRHIIEPQRLLLTWRAPDGSGNRDRHVVAMLRCQSGGNVALNYTFGSDGLATAQSLGFIGHPAFKLTDKTYDNDVLPTLMRRLPPRPRTDFPLYLEQLRLPSNVRISDFALLGYSGAKLPGDGFSVIHPFDEALGPCELLMEVADTRYQQGLRIEDLQLGQAVSFTPEPENTKDAQAIHAMVRDRCIGYVNRGLLPAFHRWLSFNRVKAQIERINGTAERPNVYLFVEIGERVRIQHAA